MRAIFRVAGWTYVLNVAAGLMRLGDWPLSAAVSYVGISASAALLCLAASVALGDGHAR